MSVKDIITAAFATTVIIPDTPEQALDELGYDWRAAEKDVPKAGRPITGFDLVDRLAAEVEKRYGVKYSAGYEGSAFYSVDNEIQLVDAVRYPDKTAYARTVLHETMHALGFHTGSGAWAGYDIPYNGEEIVNETATAALFEAWGYAGPESMQFSREYIANWWQSSIEHPLEWLIGPGPKMQYAWSGRENVLEQQAEKRYNAAMAIINGRQIMRKYLKIREFSASSSIKGAPR